jgi:hypothetical protein
MDTAPHSQVIIKKIEAQLDSYLSVSHPWLNFSINVKSTRGVLPQTECLPTM